MVSGVKTFYANEKKLLSETSNTIFYFFLFFWSKFNKRFTGESIYLGWATTGSKFMCICAMFSISLSNFYFLSNIENWSAVYKKSPTYINANNMISWTEWYMLHEKYYFTSLQWLLTPVIGHLIVYFLLVSHTSHITGFWVQVHFLSPINVK